MQTHNVSPLTAQTAIITGAGRGIGAAIAAKLAAMGATTVLCGRTRSHLEATAAAIIHNGGRADVAECDVTSLASVESVAAHVEKTFGRADILVNNAGIGSFAGPLHTMDPASWDSVVNTNLRGVYFMLRSFAPLMVRARSGHIINISSLAGKNALPNGAAYAASKWGLNGLVVFQYYRARRRQAAGAFLLPDRGLDRRLGSVRSPALQSGSRIVTMVFGLGFVACVGLAIYGCYSAAMVMFFHVKIVAAGFGVWGAAFAIYMGSKLFRRKGKPVQD